MHRHLITIPALLILICFCLFPGTGVTGGQVVDLDDGRLTLEVVDLALTDLLEEFSRHDIAVRIDPQINPHITASFRDLPVAKALPRLLGSYSYALTWRAPAEAGAPGPQLAEIEIFIKGHRERLTPLRKQGDLAVEQGADGTYFVRNRLLLRLKPPATISGVLPLVRELDATIADVREGLGLILLELPAGSDVQNLADRLAGTAEIAIAEPDFAYPQNGTSRLPLETQPDAPAAGEPARTATVPVAVLDSGLAPDYGDSPFVFRAYDAISPGAPVTDTAGHGTQMTLIAAGAVAPLGSESLSQQNPVVAIRAIDGNGFTSTHTLARSIDYAIESGARVVSMSWGSEDASPLLRETIDYAASHGLIMLGAAGNEPTGRPVYPAAFASVIGVGALLPDGTRWAQSNYGDFVAVEALGLATLPVGFQAEPGTYAGTSIATAYTARRIAELLAQDPGSDRDELLQRLNSRD